MCPCIASCFKYNIKLSITCVTLLSTPSAHSTTFRSGSLLLQVESQADLHYLSNFLPAVGLQPWLSGRVVSA